MPESSRARLLYDLVGRRIRALRDEKVPQWTQEELANRTAGAISRSTLANMEIGRQRISIHQLFAVADALGVEPQDLLPSPHEVDSALADSLDSVEAEDRAFVEGVLESDRFTRSRRRVLPDDGGDDA